MPKFLLKWDVGYGPHTDVQEHDTQEKADAAAYELAREDFENSADYGAEPLIAENAADYDLEDEL